jgi:hypothetical protein
MTQRGDGSGWHGDAALAAVISTAAVALLVETSATTDLTAAFITLALPSSTMVAASAALASAPSFEEITITTLGTTVMDGATAFIPTTIFFILKTAGSTLSTREEGP